MRIAITGGIAEGKSTVLGYCKDAGYSTCSADQVAKEVFESSEVQSKVAELFGLSIPTRDAVRKAIAAQPALRRKLNSITHELIMTRVLERSDMFAEIPLLVETCTQHFFDRVWVVTCGEDEQKKRLAARYSEAEIASMLGTQLPTKAKTPFADVIIRTNLDERTVKRYVLEIAKKQLGDIRF
ncbi:MAG TPA: dephospho-CoA kinase [Fimbriimonadaceae bacterium]|jgi:dephospho-CoA kinase